MIFSNRLIVIRGGGDIATGVAFRLHRAGFAVIVTELAAPLTVRRTVALSSAVGSRTVVVEGMRGALVSEIAHAPGVARTGDVAVVVHPSLPKLGQFAVIDARLAKRNIDTSLSDAECVVALGPGFIAGVDCNAVIETNRGHNLGRVIWSGSAEANTGVPGVVGGKSAERVVRSPTGGRVTWSVAIGDVVEDGSTLGEVNGTSVHAPFTGLVRGLIADSAVMEAGLKIADIDPRTDVRCDTISDKALAVGGGVVEAVLTHLNRTDHSSHVAL